MSLLFMGILVTIALSIEEAIGHYSRIIKLSRRRARRYTFN